MSISQNSLTRGGIFWKNICFWTLLNGFSFSKSLYKHSYTTIDIVALVSKVFVPLLPNHCFFYIIDLKLILSSEFNFIFDSKIPSEEIILSRPLHGTCTSSESYIVMDSATLIACRSKIASLITVYLPAFSHITSCFPPTREY